MKKNIGILRQSHRGRIQPEAISNPVVTSSQQKAIGFANRIANDAIVYRRRRQRRRRCCCSCWQRLFSVYIYLYTLHKWSNRREERLQATTRDQRKAALADIITSRRLILYSFRWSPANGVARNANGEK